MIHAPTGIMAVVRGEEGIGDRESILDYAVW